MISSVHPPASPELSTPRRRRIPLIRPHEYKYTPENCAKYDEIVFDLISGLDINLIEPHLFEKILPMLKEKEKQLKEWRNQPASRSIQAAIKYIEGYRFSNDPFQNPYLVERTPRPPPGTPTEEDIAFNVGLAFRKHDFKSLDPSLYKYVIKELYKIQSKALAEKDYLLAERAGATARKVVSLDSDNRFESIQFSKADSIDEKLKSAIIEFEATKSKWEKELKEAKASMESELREISKQNQKELQEFDKSFECPPPLHLAKFSAQLLQLKQQEQYLVLSRRYSEATRINGEVSRMENAERDKHKLAWNAECKLKRKGLEEKLSEKLFVRKANLEAQYLKMEKQASTEILNAERAREHLQAQARIVNSNLNGGSAFRSSGAQTVRLPSLKKNGALTDAQLHRRRAMINAIVYTQTIQSQ